MKTKLITTLSILTALMFTACSQKELSQEEKDEILQEKKEQSKKEIESLPSWVLNPDIENSISAVGISNFSKHGLHPMLTMAEMDARAKLAGKINLMVSQLQQKSMRTMQIENIDELEEIFTQVTKEVIKEVSISDAKRVNMYQGNDGALYVLMTIDNKNISNRLKGAYKEHIKDANISKENLNNGMNVLDEMLDSLDKELER
jgi:hypothetical protein